MARGLGGQTREMAVMMLMFGSINEFRTRRMSKLKTPSLLSFDDEKKIVAKLPSGEILVRGKRLTITDTNGRERVIKASYGIARTMQLRHVAALKHPYLSTTYTSVTVPRSRYRLRTSRLSEGEMLAMLMRNCPENTRDDVISGGLPLTFTRYFSCSGSV